MSILIESTVGTIQDELEIDDALLAASNESVLLRFWELESTAVVLGRGKTSAQDVFEEACLSDGVPIVKRSSGGGTVLQGPGSFNYSLILPIQSYDALSTISDTNRFIMQSHCEALKPLEADLNVSGITDLCIKDRKINGNAQRRSKTHILFHGCFLMGISFELITKYLKMPSIKPEYRENRSHQDFLTQASFSKEDLKYSLKKAWGVNQTIHLSEIFIVDLNVMKYVSTRDTNQKNYHSQMSF